MERIEPEREEGEAMLIEERKRAGDVAEGCGRESVEALNERAGTPRRQMQHNRTHIATLNAIAGTPLNQMQHTRNYEIEEQGSF